MKLALLNEILGRSSWAPMVFGAQGARLGKRRDPRDLRHRRAEEEVPRAAAQRRDRVVLLDDGAAGRLRPRRVHVPRRARRRRVRDQRREVVLLEPPLRGVRDRDGRHRPRRVDLQGRVDDARAYRLARASTSSATSASRGERLGDGAHAYVRYDNVRVPADHVLGGEGQAFVIAQTRLGGGRIHHAMRTVGMCQRALDMLCERALSRTTQGTLLADKQIVQQYVADSWIELAPVPPPGAARGLGLRPGWRSPAPARRSRA